MRGYGGRPKPPLAPPVEVVGCDAGPPLALPLLLSTAPAGFPSPAEDYIDRHLDLNEHLIGNRAATFFVRVSGDSMIGAGIHSGDIVIVDRSVEPVSGRIVIASLGGELTVKRLRLRGTRLFLVPENDNYAPAEVDPEGPFEVWGVVTYVIHKV